jgi:hypothetical protein
MAAPTSSAAGAIAPKTVTMRILIAGDEDVVPDWKKKRFAATVPMNAPIKPFLERTLCPRMKWENLDNVRIVTATGGDLSSIAPTSELFQVNLTPKQLGFEPDSIKWAWLQPAAVDDEPLLMPGDVTRQRLARFFQYYAPEKGDREMDALLSDYRDNEDLLFIQLVGRYGAEPTQEMLYRKRIAPMKAAKVGKQVHMAASAHDSQRQQMHDQANASQMAQQDWSSIALLLSRTSTSLLHLAYLRKWIAWLRSRRESRRIVVFMAGKNESFIRALTYSRWKRYSESSRIRRQLSVSTKLAFKQESVVGGLAEENMNLKQEQRKLRAHIEVLEANSSRRLESLFSSSESAIIQMKLLTSELHGKEQIIGRLEQQLLQVGNKMLAASEARDEALQRQKVAEEDRDAAIHHLQDRINVLESENLVIRNQMERMRPKTPPEICRHCPHYGMAIQEADALKAHAKALLERLDASESDRRSLADQLKAARGGGGPSPRRGSIYAPSSLAPAVPSDGNGDMVSSLAGPASAAADAAGAPGSNAFEGFGPMDTTSPGRNVSFALPPSMEHAPGQHADMGPSFTSHAPVDNRSRATSQNNVQTFTRYFSEMQGAAAGLTSQPPPQSMGSFAASDGAYGHDDQSLAPMYSASSDTQSQMPRKSIREVNLSMSSFFQHEDKLAHERMRLSLERQTMPRYGSGSAATNRGAPSVPGVSGAPSALGRYRVAAPSPMRADPSVPAVNLATASPMPGLPGTGIVTLDPSRRLPARTVAHALDEPAATRPRANPLHATFETGPTAGPAAMRSQLFSFPRS